MRTILVILTLAVSTTVMSAGIASPGEALGAAEFRVLYGSLLAGKTLVNETEQDGTVVKKERQYGKSVNTGDGDFDIPVKKVITYTVNGKLERAISIDILDRVHDIGGQALIQEEITGMSVQEAGDDKPEEAAGVEFGGIYRVEKNDKGGFDVHNFSLIPSLKIDGDSLVLSGSMVSYSCYSEKDKSVCALNVRDFDLGDYEPYKGYKVGEPIGGDYTEVFVSE